jgi:hypothetical protein
VGDGIAGREVVGIDLHLHRSVIARVDETGKELGWVRSAARLVVVRRS